MLFGKYASRRSEARYPSLWDGLVGAWCPSIQSPSGARLYDLSGRSRNGTLANMDPASDWVRRGIDFDGSNDFVAFDRNLAQLVNQSTRCAVALRFMLRGPTTTRQAMFADWNASGNNESCRLEISGFLITPGRVGGAVGMSGGGVPVQSSGVVSQNVWYHLLLQRVSSTSLELYLNGALDGTATSAVSWGSGGLLSFGRAGAFNLLYFDGQINDVAVWQRSLSAREARLLASVSGATFLPRRFVPAASTLVYRRNYLQVFGTGVIG